MITIAPKSASGQDHDIKFMKIRSNAIFIVLLSLILLFNPISILGQSSILANAFIFLFLLGIPGLLLMLVMKIRNIGIWEYFVYTIGLSVAFLMFAGLGTNWLLPWLNITDKPLSLMPLLASFDVFFLILGLVAYWRNRDISLEIKFPKLDWLNIFFFVMPVILLATSILGAMRLNNGGPNTLTLIMFGETAVYFFLAILYRDKLNENVYPWAILWISLSLLLANSLRSWHLVGWDISQEYKIFQLTSNAGRWSFSTFRDAYNACLSLTILPSIFSSFLKINPEYIFKLIVPLIFSTLPVGIYILARRYSSAITAFLASILFISQTWFMHEASTYVRQEIALLFFVLSLLAIFNKKINKWQKNILAVVFVVSIVASHYSTGYIAIILFVFAYTLSPFFQNGFILKILPNIFRKRLLSSPEETGYSIGGGVVIFLIVFAIIWGSLVTNSYQNIANFADAHLFAWSKISVSKIAKNVGDRAVFGNLNLNSNKYIREAYQNVIQNDTSQKSTADYFPKVVPSKIIDSNGDPSISKFVISISRLSKILVMSLMVLIGMFVLLKKEISLVKIDVEYKLLCFGSLVIIFIFIVFPAIDNYYGLTRVYAQSLVLLAFPAVLGGSYLFKMFTKKYSFVLLLVILLAFFYSSGLIFQFFGGDAYITLNNFGKEYDEFYTLDSEVKSAQWLAHNRIPAVPVSADAAALLRLSRYAGIDNVNSNLFPATIGKEAYVYLSHTNFAQNTAFAMNGIYQISYNAPTQFLNQNKNLVYNNGGSAIFK
jgi:uncharacterized membrane protein